MSGPLSGIRVLDITTMMLGPYTTVMLGDLGADVIKIESPAGDPIRQTGPARHPSMASTFLNLNRNKRSVVLDLKSEEGRSALLDLARTADVLVHNMRPQAMARLRLAYADLADANPAIIYCGAFGFGQNGPYADKPAFDDTIQAMTGLAALQAHFAGEPQYQATVPADKTVAVYFTTAILAALLHRERTGEGQAVEVPMFEAMTYYVLIENLYGAVFEPTASEPVYPRVVSKHRRPYKTRDGYVGLVAYNDKQWLRLFEAVERVDLAKDPRFASVADRTRNVDALYGAIAEIVAGMTTDECLRVFGAADIPISRVASTADLLVDKHLVSTGFFQDFEHPTEGRIRHLSSPFQFSRSPLTIRRGAPLHGEHTQEVLAEVRTASEARQD